MDIQGYLYRDKIVNWLRIDKFLSHTYIKMSHVTKRCDKILSQPKNRLTFHVFHGIIDVSIKETRNRFGKKQTNA